MYRVSPFTYLVSAVLSTGVSGADVACSAIELLHISPPKGETCMSYLGSYLKQTHGNLHNPNATADCQLCSISTTDQFLASINIYFSDHWRNIGLLFVYVGFNVLAAVFLYWLIRVPKHWSRKVKQE